jgi:hypothetical protein
VVLVIVYNEAIRNYLKNRYGANLGMYFLKKSLEKKIKELLNVKYFYKILSLN